MHFRDIPQYPHCHYSVHVGLDYLEDHIAHYEESYGFTMDPEYQRGHVWTTEQRERYVEHILMGGETSREIIVNVRNFRSLKNPGRAEVVDGKQRLTTLLMFLRGEVRAFGRLITEFEGKPRVDIIWKVVDLNETDVLRLYVMLNAGGTPHSADEIQRVRDLIAARENT